MPNPNMQVAYVDKFIVPLLAKAGLKVKVTRKPEYTTLKISLRRGQASAPAPVRKPGPRKAHALQDG